jgi:prolyl-tRNA editing enzyme YbaK/EbsC (Cys-tRNA(Pro) deacylase)
MRSYELPMSKKEVSLISREELLAFLFNARAYPHRPKHVRLKQTHCSYVLFAAPYVYKVKKPVNFGFLDFSTIEKRRYFSEREVELNKRLSPEVYLGVVPISLRADGLAFGPGDTAQRIAEAEHVKAEHYAKVVMVKSGEKHLMVVLQADRRVDLEKVEQITGQTVSLDAESEFRLLFPDCAVGTMPPFGSLYDLPTYVDRSLAQEDCIVFEACTHTDTIKLSYPDYQQIVKPQIADLTMKVHHIQRV